MAFALKQSVAVRTVAVKPVPVRRAVVVRSSGKDLDKNVTEALKIADETCDKKGLKSKECAVAWDNAEELLATKAHKKVVDEQPENKDPLEQFCNEAPDADECRVHDN